MKGRGWQGVTAGAILIAGSLLMLPHGNLHEFGRVPWFLAGAALMLVGFYLALARPPGVVVFWIVAVAARLLLLWQEPGGDIHRYIWEGRNLLLGWNPYVFAPDALALEPLRDALWQNVQHKSITAIYPPLAQWLFAGVALLSQSPVVFKAVFLLADLAVALLLVREFGKDRAVIHAWNPLAVYSFAGGGHYDSCFVLAVMLGWMAWNRGRIARTALWLGVATALKWLSLPLLVWVIWRALLAAWQRNGTLRSLLLACLASIMPLLGAYSAMGAWTGEWMPNLLAPNFSMVARSAAFLPDLVAHFYPQSSHSNSWLVLPVVAGWLGIIFFSSRFTAAAERLLAWTYVWSPLVHAWYFVWIIPFAVASRNAGTIALSASGFIYFLLYHYVEAPQGQWILPPWQIALLWLPFVAGFIWHEATHRHTQPYQLQ